jgi:hypothetical protein
MSVVWMIFLRLDDLVGLSPPPFYIKLLHISVLINLLRLLADMNFDFEFDLGRGSSAVLDGNLIKG